MLEMTFCLLFPHLSYGHIPWLFVLVHLSFFVRLSRHLPSQREATVNISAVSLNGMYPLCASHMIWLPVSCRHLPSKREVIVNITIVSVLHFT